MSNIFSTLRNNHERVQRILLFVAAGILIVLMLPKEGKFKYEYQKGRPWGHEDLVAPFDFAIEKPKEELGLEIAQITDNAKVYLRLDGNVESQVFSAFQKRLYSDLAPDTTKKHSLKNFNDLLDDGQSALKSVYQKGILRNSDELDAVNKNKQVFLLSGNTASEVSLAHFFSVQSAYTKIQSEVATKKGKNRDLLISVLSEVLVQNVVYDKGTTERFLADDLNSVSATRGMIPKGLKIISRGDMVDSENLLVLESLRKESQAKLGSSESSYLILLGQVIMVAIVLLMFYIFLIKYRSDLAQNNWKITFLLMLILCAIATSSIVQRIETINLYLVPFCLLPVIVRSFFDSRIALFAHIVTLIIVGFEAPNGFEFMFLELIAGIIAIFSLLSLQNRSQLFFSMLIVFVTYCASYFSIAVMQEGEIQNIDVTM
ncbi:MAG: membrane-associated HD superfamily phosphohydrolase, partial [Bacteroidia bacterium]